MSLSIQPLIDLADTDRDLQTFIFSRSQLEKQIDTASSVVNLHKKTFDEKYNERNALANECEELKKNIIIKEELISRLNEQVPKIRNEKEFAASKSQLEEARKDLGVMEEKLLELDINSEDLEKEIEKINVKLDESNTEFQQETSGLLKKQEKAEKQIAKLEPRRTRLLKKIPKNIQRFYERCQQSGISTPICAIIDKSCSGCYMVLLPQLINELMSNPNSHKNCPNCSRILYFPAEEEVVES
ncbi:MAG: hypothetical protein MAG581_00900 [Deltaproteobacteria bacterium]|jgi:predicted  nucleic acid-binding Zn-ribbon protein|nr:hypothetical protein [Deltaproteobacteria bacterium]